MKNLFANIVIKKRNGKQNQFESKFVDIVCQH